MDEVKNELHGIINTPVRELTKEQLSRVREIAEELGVSLPTKRQCKLCWINTAVECYSRLEEKSAMTDANNEGRKYVLKPNVDLFFGSVRVNAATITDELAEKIIKRGFNKKYFEKC